MEEKIPSLEERFQSLFGSPAMGGEDEKLLDLASNFSVQLSAQQIRILLALHMFADVLEGKGKKDQSLILRSFCKKYLELKKNHASDFYVMKALEYISLRKFMQEKPIDVTAIKK